MAKYILVGQGLAGSILAYELIQADQKVIVFDQAENNISSSVAAGIFNPVTGRRFVKTWYADHIFPYLMKYYPAVEQKLNADFFYKKSIFRPFFSVAEQNEITARNNSQELGPFIDKIIQQPLRSAVLNNDLGGVFLKKTGYLDIPVFLKAIQSLLISKNAYKKGFFNVDKMIISPEGIRYGDLMAERIIFCDGIGAIQNKYFSWLPFSPVKGEIIVVQMEKSLDFIFNRQIFMLPLGDGIHKIGATYNWTEINALPSETAKNYLESKLMHFLRVKYKTIDHRAGIRPATKDRRPLIGIHPKFENMGIFNGLGSKGVSLAPYFAKMFVNRLTKNIDLEKEVNINRFKYLY